MKKQELIDCANFVNQSFAERDKNMIFSAEGWKKFGNIKLPGAFLPEEFGGLNHGYHDYANNLFDLGYYSHDNGLNFGLMAHSLACLWPIFIYGDKNKLKPLLNGFASGEYILSNAISEEKSGSDVYDMITKAELKGENYIINGNKSFCSNSNVATHLLLFAETSPGKRFFGGITAFLIPINLKGITVNKNFEKMGLRTACAGTVSFSNVEVSPDMIIGKPGNGGPIFQESMVFEKLYFAVSHTGTLTRWLEQMVEFAKTRTSGGQPINRNQVIAHILADVKIQLETAKALVNEGIHKLNERNQFARVTYAAIVKHSVSKIMVDCAIKMLNLFAGQGYKTDGGIEVQVRDFLGSTIYSGTLEIQKNIIFSGLNK